MDDWEDENVTIEEYLLSRRGTKRIPVTLLVPLTIVYSVLLILGIIGNVAVCFVIKRNPSMHTATNYHLFSLAVSDLCLLIFGLPNDLILYYQQYPWIFGETFCKLRAMISEMSSYTSVLTIVAFSVERYMAICHPMTIRKFGSRRRALGQIAASYTISMVAASPFAFFTQVNYVDFPPGSGSQLLDSAFCAMLKENIPIISINEPTLSLNETVQLPIYEMSSFIFFLLPLLIIIVLYSKIAIALKKANTIKGKDNQGDILLRKSKEHKREAIIKMLIAVVIGFFVCWAPFHAQRLLYLYGTEWPYYYVVNEYMYYITGFFYYISSSINPILYNLMSVKYRKAFKQTFFKVNNNSSLSSYSEAISLVRQPSKRSNPDTSDCRIDVNSNRNGKL